MYFWWFFETQEQDEKLCIQPTNDCTLEIEQLAGLQAVSVVHALISEMHQITGLLNKKLTSAYVYKWTYTYKA